MRTTQRKGDIAVTKAIARFTELGHDVALPVTESAPYDLIVDVRGKCKRVQVKYTSESNVDLRSIHSNSAGYVVKKMKKESYDWLFVLTNDHEEFLFKKCLPERRSLSLKRMEKLT